MFEQFVAMTRSIIERDGLEGYLPTLLLPQRQDVHVLDDIPEDEEHEPIATNLGSGNGGRWERLFPRFQNQR